MGTAALIYVAIAVAMLLGLVLLGLGVRGRSIGDHPHCRRCGFDLHGLDQATTNCPECGRDRTARNAVRIGRHKRRPIAMTSGALLVIASLTGAGALVWGSIAQFNWNTIKPAWLLTAEARGMDHDSAEAAVVELVSRIRAGTLAERWALELAEISLDVQADENRAWTASWGELAGVLLINGNMTADQIERHLRQAVETDFEVRPVARAGSTTLMRIHLTGQRLAWAPTLMLRCEIDSIYIGDRRVAGGGSGMTTLSSPALSRRLSVGPNVTLTGYPEGSHPIISRWRISLLDGNLPESQPAATLGTLRLRHETAIEIVGPDGDDIRMIQDGELAEVMARSIRAREPRIRVQNGNVRPQGMIDLRDLPVPVAFEIIWQVNGREYRVGDVAAVAEDGRYSTGYSEGKHMPDLDVQAVTIILRPSAEVARRTAAISEIWGRELVFENMRVYRDGEMPEPDPEAHRWWQGGE